MTAIAIKLNMDWKLLSVDFDVNFSMMANPEEPSINVIGLF